MNTSARNSIAYTEEHEQGSLISVSDLMAGLLFVFMITLVVFALNLKGAEEKKEKTTKELREEIYQLKNTREIRDRLLKDIERSLEEHGVKVQVDLVQGVLRLPEEILLPSGSDELQLYGMERLNELAIVLWEILPCYAGKLDGARLPKCSGNWHPGKLDAVFVEGHTDNRPVKSSSPFRDNWHLSSARAIRTFKELIATEPLLDKIGNNEGQKLFSVSGYADCRPVAQNDNEENMARNRRIDLRFIMAAPEAPSKVVEEVAESMKP